MNPGLILLRNLASSLLCGEKPTKILPLLMSRGERARMIRCVEYGSAVKYDFTHFEWWKNRERIEDSPTPSPSPIRSLILSLLLFLFHYLSTVYSMCGKHTYWASWHGGTLCIRLHKERRFLWINLVLTVGGKGHMMSPTSPNLTGQ